MPFVYLPQITEAPEASHNYVPMRFFDHYWRTLNGTVRIEDSAAHFRDADKACEAANLIIALSPQPTAEEAIEALGKFAHAIGHWTCDYCGESVSRDDEDATTVYSQSAEMTCCNDCLPDRAFCCDHCGEYCDTDDSVDVDGASWCQNCTSNDATYCHSCENYYPDTHNFATDPDGNSVCDNCDHDWDICAECDCAVWCDNSYYDDDAEEYLCAGCYRRRQRENGACGDHDAGRSILGRRFRVLHSETCYGVELEVSACPNAEALFRAGTEFGATRFGAKPDGTDGVAKEFYSPIMRGDRGLRAIRHLCDFANQHNWKVSSACGFHLHLDMRKFTNQQRLMIASGYAATREFWGAMLPQSRRNNRYCRLDGALYDPQELLGNTWQHVLTRSYNRYAWLNVASAFNAHKTIESRLHTGTLNADKVCNWVRANLLFVDWCAAFADSQRNLVDRFYDLRAASFRGLDHTFGELAQSAWVDDRDLIDFYSDRARKFGATVADRAGSVFSMPTDRYAHVDA